MITRHPDALPIARISRNCRWISTGTPDSSPHGGHKQTPCACSLASGRRAF